MSKTITVSDETYNLIKDQVENDGKDTSKTKLQIKTLAGEVLFESEKTTIKEAVEEAVSQGTNLRDADLVGADLQDANLRDANLGDADLGDANLRDADLGDANLRDANLGDANLVGAYLGDANLEGADLRDANFCHTKFYGRDGKTKIKKNQVDNFFKALGVVVE